MALPFPTIWQRELPSWVSMPAVTLGDALVVRAGDRVHAIATDDGAARWDCVVDPGGGAGHLLHGYDDLQLTDRRPDPDHLTELVAVSGGQIAWTLALGCVVEHDASAIAAGLLYVVGNAPGGMVLRAVHLQRREIVVDVPLPAGADGVMPIGDRLLVLNRMASPGLYWLRPDGGSAGTLEETPVAEVRATRDRLVAAVRDAPFPRRTIQVRELATGRVAWTAPGHSAVIGIDGDDVAHLEAGGDEGTPVVRDAASGEVRWRGEPIASDPARVTFAGDHVYFGHMTGMTGYRRDGTPAGEVPGGRTAQRLGDRLYLGGFRFLACVDPTST
jgi:hypothetical protein